MSRVDTNTIPQEIPRTRGDAVKCLSERSAACVSVVAFVFVMVIINVNKNFTV